MKRKTKRILALLCAVVLVATTFLGNTYMKQAEASSEVTPVTLDGFENITISDFVDASGNQMEEKEYTNIEKSFFAKDIPNFDKTLLSMKVKFNSGSTTNTIYLGGTGGYTGFNFRMQATTGGWMLITNDTSSNAVVPYNLDGNRPVINASDAGDADFTSFLNNEFVLQFSFEFGTPDANNKADLKLGVYINGVLYNDAAFTISGFDMTKIGNSMFVACGANESITLKSVVIESEEPPVENDYVTLAGFRNVTISDFVDASGNQMPEGEYAGGADKEYMDYYSVDGLDNFDNVLVSMKVTLHAADYTNRIDIGGIGSRTGFSFYKASSVDALVLRNTNSMTTSSTNADWAAIYAAEGTSFLNDEFVLQMSFEYGEVDADNKADLTLGVYIDGEKCQTYTIKACDMSAAGSYLGFYRYGAGTGITVGDVDIDKFAGYKEVTVEDFEDASGNVMESKVYACTNPESGVTDDFTLSEETDFNNKLLSMKVKFKEGNYSTRIDVAGASKGSGLMVYPTADGKSLVIVASTGVADTYQNCVISKDTAEVTSFIDNQFLLQLTFNFGAENESGKTDLTIGVYINGELCAVKTFASCTLAKFGKHMGLYRQGDDSTIIIGSVNDEGFPTDPGRQPSARYERITFSEFNVADGVYGYTADLGADGDYLYGESIDKTVLCGNVRLSGKSQLELMLGGFEENAKGAWSGIRLVKYEGSGVLRLLGPAEKNNAEYGLFKTDVAGVDFLNEAFDLMWSVELIANDEDGNINDMKVGVWFNGVLYDNAYIIIPDCENGIGSLFATYAGAEGDSVTINSAEEYSKWPSKNYDKITFSDFGLETTQYNLTTGALAPNKVASEYQTLDKVAFSGDFRFSSMTDSTIIYGSDGGWNGLRFAYEPVDGNESIAIRWYQGEEYKFVARVYPTDVGLTSFTKQTFNLMVSTEIVNNDGEDEANDIKIGIWFNKVRFEYNAQEYYIVEDWGQYLKNGFGICGTTGEHVLLRNVGDYQKNPYYYEDISTYRGTTKSYPEVQGYVFAGWYADAEYKTAIEPDVTSGKAWAKFVEEDVLSVKPQIKFTVDSNSDGKADTPGTTTDLRFVTTVDNLDYRRISFYIAKEKNGAYGSEINAANYDENPRLVYEKLYAIGDNSTTIEYVPTVFSWQSEYFKAFTLTGIPEGDYGKMIKVTPYWITMDGTVVRGKTLETCVADYDKNVSQAVSVDYIGKDTMPITGFSGPYPVSDANDAMLFPNYVTDEYFKMIADSGVNVIISSNLDYKTYPDLVKEALVLGEKYGISIFVQDSTILTMTSKSDVETQIANYKGYESFGGMYLVDEPGTSSYKTNAPQVSTYQTIAGILNELDILTYVNLFPIVDTTEAGFWESIFGDGGIKQQDKTNYSNYVSDVNSALNPAVMMWDYYPFVEDDSKMDLESYFWNMAEIRRQAQGDTTTYADDKPFWAYVQAGGNWNDDNGYITTTNYYPNEGEFNWNMNTALAFGAQGIQYFPLIQPKHFAYAGNSAEDKMWDFNRNGLIGAFGNKTEWYDYAQKANAHVGAIDSVLMNSYSKQIIAVGDDATNATSGLNGVVTSASYNELTSASGNALIGCFDYKGKTALYVVNYDYTNAGDVTLTFDGTKNVTKIENAKETTTSVSNITLNMTAGEGILLIIE